jgi:hypothetical protein
MNNKSSILNFLFRSIGLVLLIIPLYLIDQVYTDTLDPLKHRNTCPPGACIECVGTQSNMDCIKCKHLVTDSQNKTCGIEIEKAPKYYGIDPILIQNCIGVEIVRSSARCFLCNEGYILTSNGLCKRLYKENCIL